MTFLRHKQIVKTVCRSFDALISISLILSQFHKLNYRYNRREVEDVIILVTTRYTSDVSIAEKEMQLYRRMGIRVISVAVGRQRYGVSMQLQQMTSKSKLYVTKFRALNQHVVDVIREICPVEIGLAGKYFLEWKD